MRAALKWTANMPAGLMRPETIPSELIDHGAKRCAGAPLAGTLENGACLALFCSSRHGREP